MNLRLASGSVTPARPVEEQCLGVHMDQRDVVAVAEQASRPAPPRSARIRPWSTNTQVSCSPIASWISTAATALSTPPDRPQITLPVPTCSRMSAILASRKARHRPVAGAAADVPGEIGQQLAAVGRVHDLGVEHHRVEAPAPRRWRSRTARLRTWRRSRSPAQASRPGRRGSSTPGAVSPTCHSPSNSALSRDDRR